jgi:DNA-binding MltR family transcriptional regulator
MNEDSSGFSVVREVMAQYLSETDRSCAILICSHLDQLLETLLKARLVSIRSKTDDIFEGYGPLGSFSARIEIAYRLGLISNCMRADLHMVRKIRNHMAHGTGFVSFEMSPVKDWVIHIIQSMGIGKQIKDEDIIAATGGRYAVLRIQYAIALSFLVAHLLRLHDTCERIAEVKEDTEVYILTRSFDTTGNKEKRGKKIKEREKGSS